jgi:hypothetical protein
MAVTEKVSVAMGLEELRLARRAATEEGVSLSAYVTRAVRQRLEERRRVEAARALLATFSPEDFPTPGEQGALVELWTRPRAVAPAAPARGRQARKRRSRAT